MAKQPANADTTPPSGEATASAPAIKVQAHADEWTPPKRNAAGQEVDENDLPLAPLARAIALAEAGQETDPAGIVTPDAIKAHSPAAAQADREAIDAFHRNNATPPAGE